MYGSNAIGGVIVLTSKKQTLNQLMLSRGSFNTTDSSASIGQKILNQNFTLGLNYLDSSGFSTSNDYSHKNDLDGYQKFSTSLGLNGKLVSDLDYDLSMHFFKDKTESKLLFLNFPFPKFIQISLPPIWFINKISSRPS